MRTRKMTIWAAVTVLCLTTSQAIGFTQFNDGGTHDITTTINDDVWVDWEKPGMGTTVNLLNGGNIPYPNLLKGFNDSRLNISGGSVGWHLYAYDSSQATMSGGSVLHLFAYDSSQATMSGGSVWWLQPSENSQVTMYGEFVSSYLYVYGNSRVNWSGGTIKEDLSLSTAATLTVYGSNFAIDGTPVGFGEITSIFGGNYDSEPFRSLTGTFTNDDIINTRFRIGNDAKIVLTPEPSTLLLLCFGAVMLRRKI